MLYLSIEKEKRKETIGIHSFELIRPEQEKPTPALKRYRRTLLCVILAALLIVIPVAVALTPDWAGTGERPLTYGESPLYISEYMSANGHFPDDEGDTTDWIEVCNGGTESLSLRGFALVMGRHSFMFPRITLEPGEYAVVWLDGSGYSVWHAPFLLKAAGGETVYLKDRRGDVVDEVKTQALERNTSMTRTPSDSGMTEAVSTTPTPGFANTEEGTAAYTASRYRENDTGVVINEIMTANSSAFTDEFGGYPDYVELKNTTGHAVDISGFGLSDREYNPMKWRFPSGTAIPAKGVLLVCLSSGYAVTDENGKTTVKESQTGALLAPFGLSKLGETLYLADKAGYFIEKVDCGARQSDEALIRQEDGSFAASFAASPGFDNTDEGVRQAQQAMTFTVSDNDLQISEASSRNTAYAPVSDSYYDWIELYNPTAKPLPLAGYTLTDDLTVPDKYKLPDVTLEAGGYLLIYATEKPVEGMLSTGFALNGSCVAALYSPKGDMLDRIRLTELPVNVSKGRTKGSSAFVYYTEPTPGGENGAGLARIAAAPTADRASGQYNDGGLTVTLSGEGTIRYTTDGSVPTASSSRYAGPITLNKTGVLRAVCQSDGAVDSPVSTFSYILNENHTVDVVSLVSDPDGLFGEKNGIYATGSGASSSFPYLGANFWKDWERACTVQLLPKGEETGFSVNCGVSIFGAYSRAYEKKSFKLRFRDIYGAGKLNYPVFANRDFSSYESLVLRAGGQDTFRCLMKDDLTTTLADGILDVMASRPIILYINGAYYGTYYIREKISADFIASHYNVSPESVDLLQANGYTVNAGSNKEWLSLMDYVKTHDLTVEANYHYVTDRIDEQNYIDYLIAELYCGNTDQGNIRFFRSSEGDGKWRWILYDTDMGFQGGRLNSVWELLNPDGTGASDAISTTMINKLLKNRTFRDKFVARLEYQMDNVWNTERVIGMIDRFADVWKDEAKRNSVRWDHSTDWATNVEGLRYFARHRMDALRDEFEDSARVRAIIALSDAELDRCFKETVD